MSAEPEMGGLVEEVGAVQELELSLVDLGDALIETRQSGFGTITDCVLAPYRTCGAVGL